LTLDGNYDTNALGHIWETSGQSNETLAGQAIIETAPVIHMNGPQAATAIKAKMLTVHTLPDIVSPSGKNEPVDLVTILRRLPTPEAFPHHENLEPLRFKPDKLDRDSKGRYEGKTSDLRPPAPAWKKYIKPGDNPF
jgi:hypothetical protein